MDKFDEYKFFTERVQHRSERRQQASQIYLSVNTAIFGIIALFIENSSLSGWSLTTAILPLFIVGVIICIIWSKIIFDFSRIIGWHYEQLRKMENQLQGSYKMHIKEWEEFYKPTKLRSKFSFSKIESYLPFIFIILYVIYAVGIVVGTIVGIL